MLRIIEFAHELIKENVTCNDICVDMTIGNGHDTSFLAKLSKFVIGFDIQGKAIESTTKLLEENGITNYKLVMDSHENVDLYIKEKVKAFIFNLGYFPSGDKSITTLYNSTIKAITKSLDLLDHEGVIVIVCYPGHESGKIESVEVVKFASSLDQKKYHVLQYGFINQINNPPFVIAIQRRD